MTGMEPFLTMPVLPAAEEYSLDQKWLNDIQAHKPSHAHMYVEIKQTCTDVEFTVERKRSEDLEAVITAGSDQDTEWTLRLVVTPQVYDSSWRNVPYTPAIIEAFRTQWHIPTLCFRQQGSLSLGFRPVPGDSAWKGFLLRFVYSLPFVCGLAVAHDARRRITYGVMYGIDEVNIEALLESVRLARHSAHQPYLVPLFTIDLALTDLERFSARTYRDFLPVREAMGCDLYFYPYQTRQSPDDLREKFQAPDLTEMPRQLTALTNALASNNASIMAQGQVIACLDEQLERFDSSDDAGRALVARMRDQLELMRQVVKNIKRRNDYVKESVQAQVQMVYALLAQKDNELSNRYGADMRVIAVVTLLFLPGTFVATLFSSSFWDFSPNNHGSVVSKWVWVYWIVTIALTAGVLGVWRGYPHLRRKSLRWTSGEDEEAGKKHA